MSRKLPFLLACILGCTVAFAADRGAPGVRNVVLVHGAFADGSSWSKVIPELEKAGLNVVAVQNPLTSFEDDLAATRRAIASLDGPTILVGHSWAGVVITEAGTDPKVAGLVYVAAFAPDVGQAAGDLGKEFPPPPGSAEIKAGPDGYLTLTTHGVMQDFAQDLPVPQRKLIAATQGATNSSVFGAKVANAAWRSKPSWYVVAANDRMIQPDLERKFAKAMKAKTITLPSSHVAMLSHPAEVAKLIVDAARTAPVPSEPHERVDMITLKVNGKSRELDAPDDMPLLWALRDVLGMTGTKFGCGLGLCGACTVHVDGAATRSCITPIGSVGRKAITTIEGVGTTRAGAAVQRAWLAGDVPQCGYCQSGQIMSASALLAKHPHPTDADIDDAMSGNVCRCGTYVRIRDAIKQAARS